MHQQEAKKVPLDKDIFCSILERNTPLFSKARIGIPLMNNEICMKSCSILALPKSFDRVFFVEDDHQPRSKS